jgi:ABC-2 type transport system permease protein
MGRDEKTSFSLRRVNALIFKEFFQIIRDPSTILITIFLPLLLMFLYGSGVSLDLDHLRVGLVMQDTSPLAQSFRESLEGSPYFDVKVVEDVKELKDDMTRGDVRGFFVIPSYFSNYFEKTDSKLAPIQIVADGSETNTANFVLNYGNGVFRNWALQNGIDLGIIPDLPILSVEPRFWFNEKLKSRNFLLSGSLSIIMAITGSLLTALVVAREWERGTMEALFSTTVTTKELVFAKIVPYFFLGMITMIMCIFISIFIYDVPLRGSFLALLMVSAIFLISSLSLGLMISTITKNQVFAYQITLIVAFLPAYILSGFLFEITSMPYWIQCIADVIAAKYFVQSLQAIFLVGNVWKLILWDMIPILLLSFIFFSITALNTKKRLD